MIAATLVSMVALGFAAMYGTSQSYLTDAINASEVQGDASMVLEHVTRKLRWASADSMSDTAVLRTVLVIYKMPGSGATTTGKYEWAKTARTVTWFPDSSSTTDLIMLSRIITDLTITDQGDSVLVSVQATQGPRVVRLNSSVMLRGRSS